MERLRREADASVSAKVDGGGGGDPMELGTPRQPRVGAGGGVLGEGVDVRKMSSLEGGLGEVRVKVLEEAYEVSSRPLLLCRCCCWCVCVVRVLLMCRARCVVDTCPCCGRCQRMPALVVLG